MEKHLKYVLRLPIKEIQLRKKAILENKSLSALIGKFQIPDGVFNQKKRQETLGCNVTDEQPKVLPPIKEIHLGNRTIVEEHSLSALSGKSQYRSDIVDQKKRPETVDCKVTGVPPKVQPFESPTKQTVQKRQHVSSRIPKWNKFHETYLSQAREKLVPVLTKLSYATALTVAYRKTAEAIATTDVVGIAKGYKQAFSERLDDSIPFVWKELPDEDKMNLYSEKATDTIEKENFQFDGPNTFNGEYSKLDDASTGGRSEAGFGDYVPEGSTTAEIEAAATDDALQKFIEGVKEFSFTKTAEGMVENINFETFKYSVDIPKEKVSDVSCYLLSLIATEEQMRIFKEQEGDVLQCFLDLPVQDLFLDGEDLLWTLLLDSFNIVLLWKMSKSVANSDFPKLVRNFFLKSPNEFRKQFVGLETRLGSYFREFIKIDLESIKAMFKNLDAADRARLARQILKLFYILFKLYKLYHSESEPSGENDGHE